MGEVCACQSNTWNEYQAVSDAPAEPVGKEDLPIGLAEAEHEQTENIQDTSAPEHDLEKVSIQSSSREGANPEHQTDLERSYL